MNTDKIYAENIVNQYTKKETLKVEQLKRLDQKVKSPATIFAYTFGIIGSLILGIGMCLAMKIIGNDSNLFFVLGIIIGIIGIILVCINYPIYNKILKARKEKYAFEIVELAKEICENEDK